MAQTYGHRLLVDKIREQILTLIKLNPLIASISFTKIIALSLSFAQYLKLI